MRNMHLTTLLLTAFVCTALTGAAVRADDDRDPEETVTVQASASVYTVPDKARITFEVTKEGSQADSVQSEASQTAAAVTDAIEGSGVEEKSIQTSSYSLGPKYNDSNKLIGYTATVSITVRDLDISEAGRLIGTATGAGATGVDSVQYFCSDYDDRYEEALAKAVAAAAKKADVLAHAAGRKPGDVVSVTEGYQDTSARYEYASGAQYELAAASDSAMNFDPGVTEIEASVTAVYELKD